MIEHVFPPEMMQERERQLILALSDCAGAYFDINFTKNRIIGTPIQTVGGKQYSTHERIGMPDHCPFTDIIQFWGNQIPEEERPAFFAFFDIERIKECYARGERTIAHRYWTKNARGDQMLAIQKIRLYEDCVNGDLLGLAYATDDRRYESMVQTENELSELYREASHRVAVLQRASSNIPGGYHRCSTGEGYPFLFVSKSFEKLVGYTKEQLEKELDNKFINLVLPEDLPRFAGLEHDLADHGHGDVAYRIRRRDGQIRWVQDSTMAIDWEGESGYQCTIADITDFVQQQEEFARQKAEFEELAENIPCGYHRCTTDGGFLLEFVSTSFLDTVGYTREEVLGKPFIDMVAPEDRDFFMSHEAALVSEGKIELAYRLVRKDGSHRWIKDSTMRVEQNGKEYYQCILADITDFVTQQEEMMQKHMALMRRESMLEIIEKNMPGGYHRCKAEPGCPITYIGNHFTDIVGFTKEEIETRFGNIYQNLMWHEDAHMISTYEQMLDMRGKGNVYDTTVYRIRHKDGGYRWVTDSTMFVDQGEDSFFQGTIADITEYIEGLESAKKAAEASNQAKSTFLFNASHDIRTPMNAIKGFAYMIAQNVGNEQIVAQTVRKIQQASDTLMSLMNDILDLARIEQGKEEINAQVVDLYENGKNLYEMFVEEMRTAGINFVVGGDELHERVLCDDLKLTRIVMNMLSNAKKFTPAGGTVVFGTQRLQQDAHTGTYRFFVRDNGIGMSEEFLKRAFEQFERERTSTESGVTGSGLGLAIIKKLMELMNGQVDIQSELGKGTEISAILTFPLVKKEDRTNEQTDAAMTDMGSKRVLLVEDNEFNREIARYILEGIHFIVDEAQNGQECVEKLLNAAPGEYDLVLMDIQMPVMDGLTATKKIRCMENVEIAAIPIIAMTANAFDEDKQKCLSVGMNGHVGKPIELAALMKEIQAVMKR